MARIRDSPDRKVNRANIDGSIKVTIPPAVAKELKLRAGDTVRFAVVSEDGKRVAKFRKLLVSVSED